MRFSQSRDQNIADRTERFAMEIISLYSELPSGMVPHVLGKQLLRSGTSVGAQIAESNRAKSRPDFVSKVEGAMQELEESAYWLRLLARSGTLPAVRIDGLQDEINQLLAILTTMVTRTRQRDQLSG